MAKKTAPDVAPASTAGNAFAEVGASGLRQFSGYVREEWLRALIGRKGMLTLREMRDNDPIISAALFAIEMLLRGVPFRVEPDDKDNDDDVKAADFVQSCFTDMEHSWADLIADVLSFLQYGWGVYETVYKFRRGSHPDDPKQNSKYDDGMIGWRKFAGRAQETLLHWVFDEAGDAIAMVQLLPTGGPLLTVPLSKCLHFRTTPYKSNPEARSIMRSMYNYYFLKKNIQQIEAIGVSRDLAGLLHITVPVEWTKEDAPPDMKAALRKTKEMANLVNQNQQSAIVSPAIYDKEGNQLYKVELLATGGRRQFATTEIINRYDHGMCASVLADFITLGTGSSKGIGSNAQSTNKTDMFSLAVGAFLDIIAHQFDRRAVPDLLRMNAMKGSVKVTHGDIASRDLQELGTFILDLAQAGLLVPDASLEAHVREKGGLPAPDDPDGLQNQQDEAQAQAEALAAARVPPGAGGGSGPPKPGAKAPGGAPARGGQVGKRRVLA